MSLSLPPVRVLVSPTDEGYRWRAKKTPEEPDQEEEQKLREERDASDNDFKKRLTEQLSHWWGWAGCNFQSWDALRLKVLLQQADLVKVLNENLFNDEESTCMVARVRLWSLQGHHGADIPDPGWFSMITTSYVERWYDHSGHSNTMKSVNSNLGLPANQRMPSLAEFGTQDQLDTAVREATENGKTYLLRLSQTYNCHQRFRNPAGIRWRSYTELVAVEMTQKVVLAVQLSVSAAPSGQGAGLVEVVGDSLAGRELARVTVRPDEVDVRWLRAQIATQAQQDPGLLRLVLPDGSLVLPAMDAQPLASVLPPVEE